MQETLYLTNNYGFTDIYVNYLYEWEDFVICGNFYSNTCILRYILYIAGYILFEISLLINNFNSSRGCKSIRLLLEYDIYFFYSAWR